MYKITITEIKNEEIEKEDWEQVTATGNPRDDGPIWEYVKHKTTQESTQAIFTQQVEDIDLVAVINAVNKQK